MDGENIQISAVVLFINYYRRSMEMSREITECIKTCFDGMIFLFLSQNILVLFSKRNISFLF